MNAVSIGKPVRRQPRRSNTSINDSKSKYLIIQPPLHNVTNVQFTELGCHALLDTDRDQKALQFQRDNIVDDIDIGRSQGTSIQVFNIDTLLRSITNYLKITLKNHNTPWLMIFQGHGDSDGVDGLYLVDSGEAMTLNQILKFISKCLNNIDSFNTHSRSNFRPKCKPKIIFAQYWGHQYNHQIYDQSPYFEINALATEDAPRIMGA